MDNLYSSFYLYRKYEVIGDELIDLGITSIDADGTQEPVMKEECDPGCGCPIEPIYRWVQTEDTVCVGEEPEVQYRWTSSGWTCVGYDKYQNNIKEQSLDEGLTWTVVIPEEYSASTLIESQSTDCGYVPPTPTFEGKIKLTYSSGQTYSAECDSTSAVTYADTNIYTRSAMTSAIVGNCVTQILHDSVSRNSPFRQCSGLTSVLLPSSLRFIDDYSFAWCVNLTGITIPYGVTSIGTNEVLQDGGGDERGVFFDCSALADVYIPNTVTTIGKNAFMRCSGLTFIDIPDSVTTIGSEAFRYCTSLTSITIPNSVTSIDSWTFDNCISLTSVTIGSGATSIGERAFNGCSGLTSIDIPNSVTSIDSWAFGYCSGLTSVTIGSGVTSIGYAAFYNCSGLTSVAIPSSVTSIGNSAFNNCRSLTSITIPSGVTTIGQNAFTNCRSLTSVTIKATTPPSLGNNVFYNTNNCPIYVPAASLTDYQTAWSSYSSRIQAIP